MSRIAVSLCLFFCCLTVMSESINAAEPKVSQQLQSIAQSNNQFALDLYRQLRAEEGNLFFSPVSISAALAMTYAGAEGETEQEMAGVLQFKLPEDQVHPAFSKLMASFNAPEKDAYELRVANRLWGQQGYGFLPQFLATTRKDYDAELAEVDFVQHADQARQEINVWVERQTNNKIKDLIPQGAVNELTRLVLTNAIYFKGKWEHQFDKQQTQDAPFTTATGARIEVPLMFQKEDFRYGENDDLQLLEMPYVGGDLAMLIFLPKQVDGLPALERKLTVANLEKWSAGMRSRDVLTYVPRFKLTEQFELSSMLSALGMPSAFDPQKANFSAMNGKRNLFISAALHKAFVDVNEEGTEAAAATGIVVGATSVQITPTFRADHPFVFLIRDKKTASILFIGRVTDPKS